MSVEIYNETHCSGDTWRHAQRDKRQIMGRHGLSWETGGETAASMETSPPGDGQERGEEHTADFGDFSGDRTAETSVDKTS